jgi:hypothetical protein
LLLNIIDKKKTKKPNQNQTKTKPKPNKRVYQHEQLRDACASKIFLKSTFYRIKTTLKYHMSGSAYQWRSEIGRSNENTPEYALI